jgi:hypothetical protein
LVFPIFTSASEIAALAWSVTRPETDADCAKTRDGSKPAITIAMIKRVNKDRLLREIFLLTGIFSSFKALSSSAYFRFS